jgi:lysyl-tRNA synthetase class 2
MQLNEYRQVRIEKLNKLKALGIDVWPCKAERTHGIVDIIADNADKNNEKIDATSEIVSVMGRVTAIREMGKSTFIHINESGVKLQVYFRMNDIETPGWSVVKLLDIGDFVSVTGPLMRTKAGELSVRAKRIQFLSKSQLPLPDKWHGLQDKETRYRQRYLDLIANPEVIKTFQTRSRIIASVRRYMENLHFLEVETPMMHPIPGGATARPFITHYKALDMSLYLRIAPELYLKRLIIGGFERVFEINRSFRNEGISIRHNPEFTMMESYSAGDDLRDMMVLTENLFQEIADSCGSRIRPWGKDLDGNSLLIDYSAPFRRLTMKDAIAEYGNIDRKQLEKRDDITKLANAVNIEDADKKASGILLGELFEYHAEAMLIQPTFITEYPVELSPLTKELPGNPAFVDRFELFIGGMELANAYSELNDPVIQLERFQIQSAERESGNDEAMFLDYDFINALEHGLPPTGGLGVGLDRMVMLMTNSASIRDVVLFPFMRPIIKTSDTDDTQENS